MNYLRTYLEEKTRAQTGLRLTDKTAKTGSVSFVGQSLARSGTSFFPEAELASAAALVADAFPTSGLIGVEPRLHCPTDVELPTVEQSRSTDGAIGPRFRVAMERGAAMFGEWPLPLVNPGDYALPNRGKRSAFRFYRVLPEERVFCLNPAGGDGPLKDLISGGALELVLGEIARNPRRAAQLFEQQHDAFVATSLQKKAQAEGDE